MNILLGITGSIAAYKSCTLIREFIKHGHEVQVVITPAGKEFITPITLSALTSKPVISEFFSGRDGTWNSHVDLGVWADAMVIAPATASTIGKMAHGIADNMLVTTYLSMKAPVFVAPAMDLDMWQHASTQENLALLRRRGVTVIEPGSGFLASHLVGKGRMEEPIVIADVVLNALYPKDLDGRRILITAGPTYEKIDPVRFIGNFSSGKMGYALAEECARRGAEVTLISGPVQVATQQQGITVVPVVSAAEMYDAAVTKYPLMDAAILCAAVSDFTPSSVSAQKIKREGDELVLHLEPTRDIAAALGEMKALNEHLLDARTATAAATTARKLLVGFALETDDENAHAKEKLQKKNLDFIVLNSMRDEEACFQYDTNKVTIITPTEEIPFALKSKKEVAQDIVNQLVRTFRWVL